MSKRPDGENKRIEYSNGDVYEGGVNEQGRPDGTGTYLCAQISDQIQQDKYESKSKNSFYFEFLLVYTTIFLMSNCIIKTHLISSTIMHI